MYEVWCGIVLGIFTRGVMLGTPSEELWAIRHPNRRLGEAAWRFGCDGTSYPVLAKTFLFILKRASGQGRI